MQAVSRGISNVSFSYTVFFGVKILELFYPHAQADLSQVLSLLSDYIALLIPGMYFVSSMKAY